KVTAPPEGGIALVDRMLDMPALPRLSLPPELQLEEVRLEPKRILTVSGPRPDQGPFGERLLGTVTFGYDDARVSGSSQRWAVVQRDRRRCLVRDEQAEAAAWEAVLDAGFRRRLDDAGGPNVEVSARDLGRAVRDLVDADWEVRADGRPVSRPTELNFRVKSDIDWFELHADFDFEGRTAALPEVLAALRRGDGTVRLDDGSLGLLPEEWAARFGLLGGLGAATDDHIRFNANQVSLLDAMLDEQQSVQFDEPFEELRERFRNFEGVEPATEPDGFQGELRGYQREGLGWLEFLREFRLNGCLADDMGLGKTVQLLALLERRRAEGHSEPSLVVVPKSLMFNWEQEARRFTPDIKLLEYTGTDRDGLLDEIPKVDLVLTTYGTLRRDVVKLKEIRFDYIVLDEAQTIKNAGSQVAKASRLLKARQRLALSGTPIENHLGDLWSIFEFLNPGMLGRSSLFKSIAGPGSEDEATRQVLGKALRPFILRRTKQQVAGDLPEKSEQVLLCDMEAEQRKIYDDLLDHYRGALLGKVKKEGLEKSRMHVLEALLRLRQAACHPALLESGEPTDASAKTDVLLPQLEELLSENHKALVFSQFTSMLAVVRAQLDKAGIKYEYLDGKTRDREARVEKFQNDPATGVFLISLKAGGLGLNLTAADYVFLLDPWWNPAVEAQAVDRAHRLGQTRHVFAYRLICRDTVEEKIAELQKQKRELAGALLEEDRGGLGQLTVEDLEKLLS
ncbi:MAG: DEAD/DEAH box helicase, partial [Planctomycetota bacterium]